MDNEPHSSAGPPIFGQPAAEDHRAPLTAAPAPDRSTGRPAHTPRGARSGDHPDRPGALPPAPGRSAHALCSPLFPAALLLLLALVSWQVAATGPLLRLDRAIRSAVAHARHALDGSPLDHLAQSLSDLGGGVPAVPVLLGAGALAAWRSRRAGLRRWWLPLPAAALAALLIPLLVVPAKICFARPGPAGLPLSGDQWGWYPSGHTATSAIAYGVGALLLGRTLGARARRGLYAATALLCLGVGWGLIWCDYHWFLDVLASWCLAGLVLWGPTRRLPRPGPPDHEEQPR